MAAARASATPPRSSAQIAVSRTAAGPHTPGSCGEGLRVDYATGFHAHLYNLTLEANCIAAPGSKSKGQQANRVHVSVTQHAPHAD